MRSPTDLRDHEWAVIAPLVDPPRRRGRPPVLPRRAVVDAILYIAKTGCQWRMLPDSYGPWGAVWQQFRRWRSTGIWAKAMKLLAEAVRAQRGRNAKPSMAMIDTQVARGARPGPGFHTRGGHDGRVRGAKRTILIDFLGLPLAARVDPAGRPDSRAGMDLLTEALPALDRLSTLLGDKGFGAIPRVPQLMGT